MILVLISSKRPLLTGAALLYRSLVLFSLTKLTFVFPKGVNKDNSLFPCCTWFHLQKVIYRYKKKNNFLVFIRKQPE